MTRKPSPATRLDPVPAYRPTANRRAGSACHARHYQLIRRQRLSDPHHVGTLAPTVTRLRREGQLPGMAG